MPKYDYTKLYENFAKVVELQGMTMVELNGDGKAPNPPYVAFDVISPYIPLNFEEDDASDAFEAVVSFTIYHTSKVKAMNAAAELRVTFEAASVQDQLRAADIVPVERMPLQIRYLPEANLTAKMVGFDMRLRLRGETTNDVEPITDIQIKEM